MHKSCNVKMRPRGDFSLARLEFNDSRQADIIKKSKVWDVGTATKVCCRGIFLYPSVSLSSCPRGGCIKILERRQEETCKSSAASVGCD